MAGGAVSLAEQLEAEHHCPSPPPRSHQRGGAPAPADRILASELGVHAVELLLAGEHRVMAGKRANERVAVPLTDIGRRKSA